MKPACALLLGMLLGAQVPAVAAQSAEGAASATRVRVATFNILNYLEMDRRVEARYRPAYPKPEDEKAAIRRAIHEVSPDVLALQEMGPPPYLEELRQDLAREGLVYTHSHLLVAADPERHVAVLSRIPFTRVTPHPDVGFTYFGTPERVKRGTLEVAFGEGDNAWTLFVVHLKSRYTNRSDDPMSETRRTLEARALRDRILERFPDPQSARFAIAGDFNDTRGSRAVAAFLKRGERRISVLVPTADSRGETWTHRFRPEDSYARVDYILVSPGLLPAVVDGRGRIYDAGGALDGSDHRMVFLDFDVGPAASPSAEVHENP